MGAGGNEFHMGGMPGVTPKPVKTSSDPVTMLRADLDNERTTVGRYRERIRQAEAMGEFALSETLRAIIVQEQEHEIDLSAALDINVPLPINPDRHPPRQGARDLPDTGALRGVDGHGHWLQRRPGHNVRGAEGARAGAPAAKTLERVPLHRPMETTVTAGAETRLVTAGGKWDFMFDFLFW